MPGRSVLDDRDDNFAIVFAAMGVSIVGGIPYLLLSCPFYEYWQYI